MPFGYYRKWYKYLYINIWAHVSFLLGIYLVVELLGLVATVYLVVWRLTRFQSSYFTFVVAVYESFSFSILALAIRLFDSSHHNGSTISQSSFRFVVSSSENCLCRLLLCFLHFKNWVALWFLKINGCLCILEINNLLGTWFANILPHPVSGILIFLIVSFEAWEFVIFMKYNFLYCCLYFGDYFQEFFAKYKIVKIYLYIFFLHLYNLRFYI